MGFVDKLKNFMTKEDKHIENTSDFVASYAIASNNFIEVAHRAARICVGMDYDRDREKQKANVSKIVGYGHESVLEHSNIITGVVVGKQNDTFALVEFLSGLKYLNYHIYDESQDEYVILIGGSLRGYKHIIRNVNNDNVYVKHIKNILYDNTPKELNEDFIRDGIMEESNFFDNEYLNKVEMYENSKKETGRVELISIDDPFIIANEVRKLFDINIPVRDILDLCTATFLFKRLSRTASHQLVRHRNGITQESQRYVDYGNASFIDPLLEEAIANHEETKDDTYSAKLRDISAYCVDSYNELRKEGIKKQDARAILPNNIATRLYMTFTYTNLIKFIELRTAKGAQAEIRNIANDVKEIFLDNQEIFENEEDMYSYLEPVYKEVEHENYIKVDEPETEEIKITSMSLEEIIEFSEDDKPKQGRDYDKEIETVKDLEKADKTLRIYVKETENIYKYVINDWYIVTM